jgi:hypothetical protein
MEHAHYRISLKRYINVDWSMEHAHYGIILKRYINVD